MIDVSHRNTKCNVFGIDLDMPIAIAPTAMHKMAHFEGEVATAKGTNSSFCYSKEEIKFQKS